MHKCPKCHAAKFVAKQIGNTHYQVCVSCEMHVEGDLSFLLPKRFDFSKLEAIGLFALPYASLRKDARDFRIGKKDVFLLRYGRQLVYLPDMSLKTMRQIHPELVRLFTESCGFRVTDEDRKKDCGFASIHFHHTRKLFPDYTGRHKQKLYNLLTYKNRLNETKYHLVYTTHEADDKEHVLKEHLFQKNNHVSAYFDFKDDIRHLVYSKGHTLHTVDLHQESVYATSQIEHILTTTEDYIVGYTRIEYRDYTKYRIKVIHKKSGSLVYQERQSHEDMTDYRIIANRYLAVKSYHDGVIDLQTNRMVPYPFANECEKFVANVTENGFEDENGWYPRSEFPDIRWTGFDASSFLQLFNGFIPYEDRIGYRNLNNTGMYTQYREAMLMFKDAKEGVFYKEGAKIINMASKKTLTVNTQMMKWIKENPFAYVLEEKPETDSSFSILEALKSGKSLFGLHFVGGKLVSIRDKRTLKTNFLKKEIRFDRTQLTDIVCHVNKNEPRIEITYNLNGQHVTFETDSPYETFEVSNIG